MTTNNKQVIESLEKALNDNTSVVDSPEKLELLIERVKKAQKISKRQVLKKIIKSF